MINIALLLLLTPLIGTLILLYLQNSSKKLTIIISNLSILFSFLLSVYLLILYISSNASTLSKDVLVFADVKIYSLAFGLYIDSYHATCVRTKVVVGHCKRALKIPPRQPLSSSLWLTRPVAHPHRASAPARRKGSSPAPRAPYLRPSEQHPPEEAPEIAAAAAAALQHCSQAERASGPWAAAFWLLVTS